MLWSRVIPSFLGETAATEVLNMVISLYCAVVDGRKGCCPNGETCTSGGKQAGPLDTPPRSGSSGGAMDSKDPGSTFCLVPLLILIGTCPR